jgi:hypothetical protein
MAAGGRQKRRRHGGVGSWAAAWERRKGVEEQLQEVPELLYIGRREHGKGTRPTDHGGGKKAVRAALRQPVHTRGRAGRGHGGGLKRRAGLGEAHEGERARGGSLPA